MSKISAFRTEQDLSLDAIGRQESTASSVGGITPFGKRPTPLVDGRWFSDDAPIVVEGGRVAPVKFVSAFEDPAEPVLGRQSTARPEDIKVDDEIVVADTHEDGSSSDEPTSQCGSIGSVGFDEAWASMYAPPERNSSSTNVMAQVSPTTSTPPSSSRAGNAFLPSASAMFSHPSPAATQRCATGYFYDPYAAPVLAGYVIAGQGHHASYAAADASSHQAYTHHHASYTTPSGAMGSRQGSGDLHQQAAAQHLQQQQQSGSDYDPWAPAVSFQQYDQVDDYGYPVRHDAAPWSQQQQQQAAYTPHHGVDCVCVHCEAAAAVRARERAAPHVPRHMSQALNLQQQHRRATGAVLPTDVTVLAALSGSAHTQQEMRQHLAAGYQSAAAAAPSASTPAVPSLLRFVPPQLPPLVLITVITESVPSADEANAKYVQMAARWYNKIAAVEDVFLETKPGLTEEERVRAVAAARCPAPEGVVKVVFAKATQHALTGINDEENVALRQWVQSARAWWLHHFEHAQTSGRGAPLGAPAAPASTTTVAPSAPSAVSPAQQHHSGFARGGAQQASQHPHAAIHQVPSNAPFVTHAGGTANSRFARRR